MPDSFERRYPNLHHFVFERGWIELGFDEYSPSFIRALDIGGLIWEGKSVYNSLEEAMDDLERGLAEWKTEISGGSDEG